MKTAGEHPPSVLVGQSIGRPFVRWYQHEHPRQVVGMVLVESHEMAAPVNGKQVPLYTLTKEELQADLPPPSSLKKRPLPSRALPSRSAPPFARFLSYVRGEPTAGCSSAPSLYGNRRDLLAGAPRNGSALPRVHPGRNGSRARL